MQTEAMNEIEYQLKSVSVPDDAANGAAIRALRTGRGMQQNELAEALNISPAYLSDMERGSRGMSKEVFERARFAILNRKL